MTSREAYERHLSQAADGTPLREAMLRVVEGHGSVDDLIAHIEFELWECIYSLPPEAGPKGATNNSGPVSRVTDAAHASACAARAESSLRLLKRLLAEAATP